VFFLRQRSIFDRWPILGADGSRWAPKKHLVAYPPVCFFIVAKKYSQHSTLGWRRESSERKAPAVNQVVQYKVALTKKRLISLLECVPLKQETWTLLVWSVDHQPSASSFFLRLRNGVCSSKVPIFCCSHSSWSTSASVSFRKCFWGQHSSCCRYVDFLFKSWNICEVSSELSSFSLFFLLFCSSFIARGCDRGSAQNQKVDFGDYQLKFEEYGICCPRNSGDCC
jgi:hypothetical protein